MAEQERITEEQAFEALQQLTASPDEPEGMEEPAVPEPTEPEPPAEETAAETGTEAPVEEPPAETDDVASLKTRLAEKEETIKRNEERIQAIQDRYATNEQLRTQRFLKKSTAVDRARQMLKKAELTTEDVEKAIQVLEDTMNPASPSYAPAPVASVHDEEKAIILNDFLNFKGMTNADAEAFGTWVQREGPTRLSGREQAVAEQSLEGFLQIAHNRWQESMREAKNTQRQDTVEAVKSVQRTQKQAAKAASAAPSAPRKQPATPKTGVDVKKLTKADVSELLKQSVRQYQ